MCPPPPAGMCQTCAVSSASEASMLIGCCCVWASELFPGCRAAAGLLHTSIPHYRAALHTHTHTHSHTHTHIYICDYAARWLELQYVCRARRPILRTSAPDLSPLHLFFCIWLCLQHRIRPIIPYSLLFPEALRPLSSLVFHVPET